MKKQPIIILSGPTASGKSALALFIAAEIDAVIINCDSKQIYREIPIITAQPTEAEKQTVEHNLYGVISAAEDCSVARWIELAIGAISAARAKNKIPLLVGGTGLYIKYLTEGLPNIPDIEDDIRAKVRDRLAEIGSVQLHQELTKIDAEMAEKLKPNDGQRIARAYEVIQQTGKSLLWWQQQKSQPFYSKESFQTFFLAPDREKVYENCNKRFVTMVNDGVIDEIKALDSMSLDATLPAMKAHGVPEILSYLHGNMTLDDAIDQAQKNTRHYIKRQFTWFKHQMQDVIFLENLAKEQLKTEMLANISRFLLTAK